MRLVPKHQNPSRKLIKFSPEQAAQFEAQMIPSNKGMNTPTSYRKEGVQAQNYQKAEKERKEAQIISRMEMKPQLKRKATFAEKLRGKKDEYVRVPNPQAGALSPVDPVGEFFVAGAALSPVFNLAGKTVKTLSSPSKSLDDLTSLLLGHRPVISENGRVYQLKNDIPVENLNTYLKGRVNPARTPGVKYSTPDMYLIGQNIDREMAFLPQDLRKELVNYIKYPTPINKQKAQSIIDTYGKEYGGTKEFEKIITPYYKRALGAKKATIDPRVTEYQSFYELPMDYLERTHFEDLSPNVGGLHFHGGSSYVRKPVKGDPSVPFHEAEHGYQSQLAEYTGKEFTSAQEDMLNKAYKTTANPEIEASKDILEKGSTNAELRRKIAKMYEQQHGKQSSYDELNTFIDNLDDRTVTQIYRDPINGYHNDYISGTIGQDLNSVNDYILKPGFITDLKQAWKYVPTVATPIIINQNNKLK